MLDFLKNICIVKKSNKESFKMAKKNAFANAKIVSSVKASKAAVPVTEILGLGKYAAACALEKAIKAVKARYESAVKDISLDIFASAGAASGTVPENFKAAEGLSEASVQLKRRASNSTLTPEEIAMCEMHKIPVKVIEGAFYINPAYSGMTDLMKKVGEAIAKVPGLPDDFILKQEDVTVASEEGIQTIFASKDKKLIDMLLPIQTTVALRTSTAMKTDEILKLLGDDLIRSICSIKWCNHQDTYSDQSKHMAGPKLY